MNNEIIGISYSHENADVAFRDRISLSDSESLQLINAAYQHLDGIRELGTLSTCNRTEIYAVGVTPSGLYQWLETYYRDVKGVAFKTDTIEPAFLSDRDTVRHLLEVAGGLRSMMLGENQILSQVKISYELFRSSTHPTPILNRLFRDAIRAGKIIRTRTALCKGAASISLAAVELSRKIYSSYEKLKVMVVGAGEAAELVLLHFSELGVNQFLLANRGRQRREKLALKYKTRQLTLADIPAGIEEADIVLTATHSSEHLIHNEMLTKVVRRRKHRPLLIIDISTPRNVDPAAGDLPGVFLYNIDNLKQVVTGNLEKRKKDIPAAQAIVKEITSEFFDWYKTLDIVPTIARLNDYFHQVRKQELNKYTHRVTDKEFEHLEELSRSLVRKLLHFPISVLKDQNSNGNLPVTNIDALWELFRLRESEKADN